MELGKLSPASGSVKNGKRIAVKVQVVVVLPRAVTKGTKRVLAPRKSVTSKVVKHLCSVVCRSVVSKISTA
jgi:hypothetical protein